MAYTEIDYLRDQASNRDDEVELKKLDEINQFIMSIEKKYEFTQLTLLLILINPYYAYRFQR